MGGVLMLFLDSSHGLILVTGGLQCVISSIFRVRNKLKEIIKETVLTFTKSRSGLQWRDVTWASPPNDPSKALRTSPLFVSLVSVGTERLICFHLGQGARRCLSTRPLLSHPPEPGLVTGFNDAQAIWHCLPCTNLSRDRAARIFSFLEN